jgi:hypothetical protein
MSNVKAASKKAKGNLKQQMANDFDVVVLGAGPGGYVAAIRAAHLKPEDSHCRKEILGWHLRERRLHSTEGSPPVQSLSICLSHTRRASLPYTEITYDQIQ